MSLTTSSDGVVQALLVRVAFPRGVYSGGDLGTPEELPSPARVHAAFVSAAAGGPWAGVDDRVLVAGEDHEQALRWLEEHDPIGVLAPAARMVNYRVSRYRLRAAVNHANETEFEPFTALSGSITYAWPAADRDVLTALRTLAPEVTHVGRADSIAIVDVWQGEIDQRGPGFLSCVAGRGPGRELRVPTAGRFAALVDAHRRALRRGGHGAGSTGRQASDQPVDGIGEQGTRLARFAAAAEPTRWPFSEVWRVPVDGSLSRDAFRVDRRVRTAVAVHRAVIAAIGDDVPAFVTGRDGDQPLRGAGHLAIHLTQLIAGTQPELLFAIPAGAPEADRATLIGALVRRPTVRIAGRTLRLDAPKIASALEFWPERSEVMATEVPMVLDAPGTPRVGRWTLDDAVLCSIGYALRGMLEADGISWGSGWQFRQTLVATLRERGVSARARRVTGSASPFTHRARDGDLLVAVHGTVTLGEFAADGRRLLALGRARHLGGGLLRPVMQAFA
jgi:CRISPR-associated protein Csb2